MKAAKKKNNFEEQKLHPLQGITKTKPTKNSTIQPTNKNLKPHLWKLEHYQVRKFRTLLSSKRIKNIKTIENENKA